MFNFFTALFGGLYYAGKQTYEKSKLNEYEKTVTTQKRCRDNLKATMCISFQAEESIKEYILSGQNYDNICEKFGRDFKFVFGSHWKSILRIPPMPPVLDPKLYKSDAYSFFVPANHIYWVYRLILASKGKVDHTFLTVGYCVGGVKDREMNIRFAQCIERRLVESGKTDIRLVFEQTDQYDPGTIIIEPLCTHTCKRLW